MDKISEKRASEGSARWSLSKLWRPISQSMLPSSTRSSTQEGFLSHLSVSIPPFFSRVEGTISETDIEAGTLGLLSEARQSILKPTGGEIDTSPTDDSSVYRSPKDEDADQIRPPPKVFHPEIMSARPSLHEQPCEMSTIRSDTISSRATTKRLESRDTRFLAELPALPVRLRSIKSSRPTVVKGPVAPRPDTRDSCPPPVPSKEAKTSTFADENPNRRTLVLWDGPQDPENAMNWNKGKKWAMTLALGFLTFCVSLASSIFSPATHAVAAEFAVSEDIMILPTALFMAGLALASPIWSPLIERYGRKLPLFCSLLGFSVFQIPVAVASNVATLFACRFVAGLFGCGILVAVIASLLDLWASLDRGLAMAVFSAALLIGLASGPLVGAPITDSSVLGWTWTSWIVLILCFPFGLACVFLYKESSSSVLLQRKAKVLRRSTRDWALHAQEEEETVTAKILLKRHLWKPFRMLTSDSIIFLTTFYMSFIFGVLYLIVETYPLSFNERRHWPLRLSGLPAAAIIIGVCIGCVVNFLFTRYRFAPLVKKYGRLFPEERLLPMVLGSALLPCGLFLMGWTSFASILPVPEILAGVLIGVGSLLVFLQGNNYLLDVYSTESLSIVALNTTLRSIFAAGFSVFAKYMYERLQPQWTFTILGVIAVVCMPIPIAFFRFGVKLRAMSKWTPKLTCHTGSASVEGFPVKREG